MKSSSEDHLLVEPWKQRGVERFHFAWFWLFLSCQNVVVLSVKVPLNFNILQLYIRINVLVWPVGKAMKLILNYLHDYRNKTFLTFKMKANCWWDIQTWHHHYWWMPLEIYLEYAILWIHHWWMRPTERANALFARCFKTAKLGLWVFVCVAWLI